MRRASVSVKAPEATRRKILERGVQAATVKASIAPENVAALVVAAQMGVWGSGKSSRNTEVMRQAAEGLCAYLESLRP